MGKGDKCQMCRRRLPGMYARKTRLLARAQQKARKQMQIKIYRLYANLQGTKTRTVHLPHVIVSNSSGLQL